MKTIVDFHKKSVQELRSLMFKQIRKAIINGLIAFILITFASGWMSGWFYQFMVIFGFILFTLITTINFVRIDHLNGVIDYKKNIKKSPVWFSVKKYPLITENDEGRKVITQDEFIAAVFYFDNNDVCQGKWWTGHCVYEGGNLCEVGKIANEPCGWDIEDVEYWHPVYKLN